MIHRRAPLPDNITKKGIKNMGFKDLFTPVTNMDASQLQIFIDSNREGGFTLLDVRQPAEYENARIPGSKLIPLPDLNDRLSELDLQKPIIAY
jgi:rhodanese-related sulfurtransferase